MSKRFWLPRYVPGQCSPASKSYETPVLIGPLESLEGIQRPLSKQRNQWFLSLAQIKFQIELEALMLCENLDSTTSDSKLYCELFHWGKWEGFHSWSHSLKGRSLKSIPVAEAEALTYIIDLRGLPGWRIAREYCRDAIASQGLESHLQRQKVLSGSFVYLGKQLLEAVLSGHVDDLNTMPQIIDAVELQLSLLGSFGQIYHRHMSESGKFLYDDFTWHTDLRGRIRDVVKQDEARKASRDFEFIRSPLQRQQDNLLLQALLGALLLACIYPLYRALRSSSPRPGSPLDADFWQLILNVILQLAGFLTLLLPIYRETIAKEWVETWILSILGILSALVTVPLYLFAPISWSTFFSWLGASSQLLVVLQVALVATFRNREHVKQV